MSDPDDWFGGVADEEDVPRRRAVDEDWLHDAPAPARPWYEGIERRYAVVAVIALAALIAVLAAAGVFSGGGHTTTPPPTATTTPVTTPATTPTPTPTPSVPAPTATLKPGDTGAQVKVLQRALAALGYSTGKVDGGYGPATEAAVKSFQQKAGLKADGIVGPASLRALKNALRNR